MVRGLFWDRETYPLCCWRHARPPPKDPPGVVPSFSGSEPRKTVFASPGFAMAWEAGSSGLSERDKPEGYREGNVSRHPGIRISGCDDAFCDAGEASFPSHLLSLRFPGHSLPFLAGLPSPPVPGLSLRFPVPPRFLPVCRFPSVACLFSSCSPPVPFREDPMVHR